MENKKELSEDIDQEIRNSKHRKNKGFSARFEKIAAAITKVAGSSPAFLVAVLVILVWAVSGPLFGFSDTWQLVINTGTTIITFLMVFLIQQTQNKDSLALQLLNPRIVFYHDHHSTGRVPCRVYPCSAVPCGPDGGCAS